MSGNANVYADLVLINGKIVTIDAKDSIAEAVANKFGRIVVVGSDSEVKPLIGDDTEVVDLCGRTVLPGLIDSHCHMLATGGMRAMGVLDLSYESGVRSIADIQERINRKAENTPPEEWIIGSLEDDSKLTEKRHPTRWELDEAARDNPVMISTVGGHFYISNSKAFELAGVTKETPDPVGGVFDRDPETGDLTGGLHERARLVLMPDARYGREPTPEEAVEGAKAILEENARTGLTCVYDMVNASHIRAVLELKRRGELPIRVRMDAVIELFPELNKVGIVQGFGDEWVRLSGLKAFLDGAISARTAAVSEPYLHKHDFYGVMATTREEMRKTLLEAYEAGYRISAHANGDRAIEMFLDIMEEAQKKHPREDPRNRDIHCTVVNPRLIERIHDLGILPTIFGAYPYYHGDKILPAFGADRLEWMFAARSFLDAGVKVSAHSDHSASPYLPLMGIHALVNRRTTNGLPIGESQRVTVMEAIKLYTINAAYQSFDEDMMGSIEVGKFADFVVLGEDILAVQPERIIDIPVEMTIVGGQIVYQRLE
jgi:predicted amidohydrolase YtcJ